MKQLLVYFGLILLTSTVLVLCRKESKESVEMNYEQLSSQLGASVALDLFDHAGKTESNPLARGGKKVKAGATLSVLRDLTLTDEGDGSYKTTLSTDWFWAGINNGATGETSVSISSCNVTNPSESHPETATGVLICFGSADASKNGWTMDSDNTIHLSNTL